MKKTTYYQKDKKVYKEETTLFGTTTTLCGEYDENGKYTKVRSNEEKVNDSINLIAVAMMFVALPFVLIISLIRAMCDKKERTSDIISQMGSYNTATHEERIEFFKSKTEKIRSQSKKLTYSIFVFLGILIILLIIILCRGEGVIKRDLKANYVAEYGGSIVVDNDSNYYEKYEQVIKKGNSGKTITAVPLLGWYFTGWSDGVTEPSRNDIINKNTSITANFSCYFSSGIGIQSEPFIISNATEFNKMVDLINSSVKNYSYFYYKLSNSINFNNQTMTPIGKTYPFSGNFDGNDCTLSNFVLDSVLVNSNRICSLFVNTKNATIKNLKLLEVTALKNVTCTGEYIYGTLIGIANNSIISRCSVKNVRFSLNSSTNNSRIISGGLIGRTIGSSSIYNCSANVNANINTTNSSSKDTIVLGGLVGEHKIDTSSYIHDSYYIQYCSTSGTLTAIANNTIKIGGIYGYCEGSSYRHSTNSSSTCNLYPTADTILQGSLWGEDK